ncbi:hypothetical protein DUNSADRAFT_7126 [Dunaliella salina]|uniref:Uncharacterized protein n=1 Tax=Dunaliella salina TaxID=3046 RepID=A0ABQ7GLY6_DUNSA|nr:hypothetical protein DUNSADRAFT_7126 [Dunaliella salina]|eukprot:KAF5835624.1 hypothetical protein DUNSADRAFT_7126 [Dunaliella salina]
MLSCLSLTGYKGASDLFIDANVQLSLAGARRLAEAGRKVHLVMPDQGEYDRTYRMFKPAMSLMPPGVTLGHLKEGQGRQFSFEGLFQESGPDSSPAGQQADTYIVINATSVELNNVRDYVNRMAPPGEQTGHRKRIKLADCVLIWQVIRDKQGLVGLVAVQFFSAAMHTFPNMMLPRATPDELWLGMSELENCDAKSHTPVLVVGTVTADCTEMSLGHAKQDSCKI